MTIADLKAHLNITWLEDDPLLTAKLSAATDWIAQHVGASDINATPVKEAILQLAATLYEQREAIAPGNIDLVPFSVMDLIEPYRVRSFG